MKKYLTIYAALVLLMTLTSCDAIGTIFKAGMWWAFILIGGVVALIIWLLTRGGKNG